MTQLLLYIIKNKNLTFLVFLFYVYTSQSQEKLQLDSILSLGKEYIKQKDYKKTLTLYNNNLFQNQKSTDHVLLLSEIGDIHYRLKQYKQSCLFYKKAISIDSSITIVARNYLNLSYSYRKLTNRDSALFFASKLLNIQKRISPSRTKYDSQYKLGLIFKSYDMHDTALSLLLSAYDGFLSMNNEKKLANICNNIAHIQRILGNTNTSLTYYHKGLVLEEKLNNYTGIALVYNNIGNAHKSLKKLDSALHYYQKSIKIKEERALRNKGFTLHNIGTVLYMRNDLNNSKKYYQKALKAKKSQKDSITTIYTYNELALIALKEAEYAVAKRYLDSSKQYIEEINEATLRWYEIQTELNYTEKNYIKAYEYQKAYIEAYKYLFDTKKTKAIIDNQEKFDTANKIKKIENLQTENEITVKTLDKTNKFLISISILFITLLILYFITRQRQKLRIQEEDINNLKKLFKSQDLIRNKIGRDLHDIVKSRYEGIRLMIISLYRSTDLKNNVKDITQEIIAANEQVRMLSHRLSPLDQRIRHSTLSQIIKAELNKLQLYTNIEVTTPTEFPIIWNQMNLDAKNHVYGIFLEAINNIRDHSNASEVIIAHKIKDNDITEVSISDNGKRDTIIVYEGIGIGNMKSRAKLLKGELTITTTKEEFKICLNFPVRENIDEEN
ncbi:tetratricopeptide repeat-containing sensor histidine kinase [uncultured Kordia sp.]|uniref:tetratricopeptide repeat-containing sensor histidine kinase n=1 Tax=uncultured Kordia sp. TaxID=507699 RepID=UPI0026346CDC|nr:tetratricopeptide repeat-containing sensor histidine kinase [uncultured Kordia sp.]